MAKGLLYDLRTDRRGPQDPNPLSQGKPCLLRKLSEVTRFNLSCNRKRGCRRSVASFFMPKCLFLQVWLSGFVGKSLVNVILESETDSRQHRHKNSATCIIVEFTAMGGQRQFRGDAETLDFFGLSEYNSVQYFLGRC